MFASDRDLLALEPNLFRDVSWTGQQLVSGTATIDDNVLEFATQNVALDDAAIGAGHIVLIGNTPYEVIERLSASQLSVSLPRAHDEADPLPVGDLAIAVPATIHTFVPQIDIVHRQLLRMLGIEPGAEPLPSRPGESDITNPRALQRCEALGALHLVFSAAGSLTAPTSALNTRAELYRRRYAQERERVVVALDCDGDGLPDTTRKLNLIQFTRA